MRRERVETGIYLSDRANGRVYEIGWYDKTGRQRWRTVGTNIEEARKLRAELALTGRGGGAKYRQMRRDLFWIADVAARYDTPTKRQILDAMKATTGTQPRRAWLTLAGLALAQARRYESKR